MTTSLYRNASAHAIALQSGRTLAPGEDVDADDLTLDEDGPSSLDAAHVESGALIPADDEGGAHQQHDPDDDPKPAKKKAARKPAATTNDQKERSL